MKTLLAKINPEMYFLGAVENSDYEKGFVDSFKSNLPNVLQMRQDLFIDIFQMETHFELKALVMVDKVRVKAKNLYEELYSQFSKKNEIQNPALFQENCQRLGSWLPFLDPTNYNTTNSFLLECDAYVKTLEVATKPIPSQ